MKNIILLAIILIGLGKGLAQEKPNIVLLFVDDYGWADVGFRNSKFHTPNIDHLKKDGFNFNRAYIATPTCSPSRASLLTGKEPVRFQMVRHIIDGKEKAAKNNMPGGKFNLWPTDPVQMPSRNWLPLEEVTYAERLKEFGYYNMFIGKWHLGSEKYHPVHQGFDAQYGTGDHGHPGNYYAPFFKTGNPLPDFPEGTYLTDVLTEGAEKFITEYDKEQPFMLSLWYYNVHGPHIGRTDWVERYKKEGLTGKDAEYAAMVSAMDESVGKVRKAIDKKGIAKNTVVILLSDQGGYFSNAPLSGGKTGGNTLGEGGARVPFIISYPGVTMPGISCDVPVQSIDVFPTLVEIASGKKSKNKNIQGKSLMPLLQGKEFKKRNLFFFRSYEDQYTAIMNGDWKMVKYHSGRHDLFNIKEDQSESKNLINIEVDQAKKMKKQLEKWEKEAVPEF
ncbi:sulfatase [Zobellia sp. 1_MG-2023]|uniref:sulfatase n=1 Tax=Zobellia sp. 1_MG-2023 TaxID=3062626 RepID=UPI0026E2AAE9|nr:sulfatase [Zobellia sp. 1_MG-2023]MDO6818493.1 sulfatase [Zobellia sp. 1_MG-2023]